MSLDKLTNHFFKLAQQAPDQTLVDFAFKMKEWSPVENPGLTVDVGRLQEAGQSFYAALVNKKTQQMLLALKTIISLSSAGAPAISQEAKQMYQHILQSLPKPAPKKLLGESQYKLLNELVEMAQKSGQSDTKLRQQIKEHYQSSEMADQIAALKEYLEFQEATVSTQEHSKDEAEKAQAAAKEKEVGAFRMKLDSAISTLNSMVFHFGGTEREVASPDPFQKASPLT